MHVISRKRLVDFWAEHPQAEASLRTWFKVTRSARWRNFSETRQDFPHADQVRVASGATVTVFNIAGNRYRLVTAVHYDRLRLYALRVLTHAAYMKGQSSLGGPGAWRDLL